MRHLALIPLFLVLLFSCGGAQTSPDPRGTLVGKHYSNDLLGFSFDLTPDWDTVSGGRYYNNQKWNDVLDSSIEGRENLPYKFTHLIAVERGNPQDSLYCVVGAITEDLAVVGSARQYFEYTEQLVSSDWTVYPRWEFSDIRPQKTIGGEEFLAQGIFVWTSPTEKRTRMNYCREIGDKLLVVTISGFQSTEALVKAKELLASVKWHNQR